MQHNKTFFRLLVFLFIILASLTIIIQQSVLNRRIDESQEHYLIECEYAMTTIQNNFSRYSEQILSRVRSDEAILKLLEQAQAIHTEEILPLEKQILESMKASDVEYETINELLVNFVADHEFVNTYSNALLLNSISIKDMRLLPLRKPISEYYRAQVRLTKLRNALYKSLEVYYSFLDIYSCDQIQVVFPDGVNLIRFSNYDPKNPLLSSYGDDLSETRKSLETVCSAEVLTTFEAGRNNTYYRVIMPILSKSIHLASIETGIGIKSIEKLMEMNIPDWKAMAILSSAPEVTSGLEGDSKILASDFKDGYFFLNYTETEPGFTQFVNESMSDVYYSKLRNRFLSYEHFSDLMNINGKRMIAVFHPVKNYDNSTIGYFLGFKNFKEYTNLIHTRNKTALISILVIMIILMIIYYLRCKRGEKHRFNQALGTVTEKLLEGIIVVKREGNVQFVNKAGTLFLNDERENILKLHAKDLISKIRFPKKVSWEEIVAEITDQGFYTNDDAVIMVDTVSIAVSVLGVYIAPTENITHDFQDCIVIMLNDITHHKVYEQQLIEAKEDAETSNKLKSTFLNNFSHEVRTPLNSIIGFTYLLENDNPPREAVEKYIDIISKNSHYLLSIVQNIIEISQLERDEYRLYPDQFSLNGMMREIFSESEELIQESRKPIKLLCKTELDDGMDLYLNDRKRLKEVLALLIDNAVKFTELGQVEFGYRLHEADTLLFWVNDTGIGIEEEQQSRIFQPFYQIKDGTHLKFSGTGLGLSIAANIVQLMGGNVWIKSEYTKGTTMYFALNFMTQDSLDNELAELGLDDF